MNIDLIKFFEQADVVYPFKGEASEDTINEDLDEFKILEPVKYKGEIFKTDGAYMLNADVDYKYETKCARCFDATTRDVNTSFTARLEDYQNQYQDDEEDDIIYYDKGILDMEKYILMEVASTLPMRTLCDENCKGLCPKCGIDLNKETCDCKDDYIDPRFEKLKDFFLQE